MATRLGLAGWLYGQGHGEDANTHNLSPAGATNQSQGWRGAQHPKPLLPQLPTILWNSAMRKGQRKAPEALTSLSIRPKSRQTAEWT